MTLKYIWRSFSLGCHFHVHFSYPWHAFASHGLPAIAELLVNSNTPWRHLSWDGLVMSSKCDGPSEPAVNSKRIASRSTDRVTRIVCDNGLEQLVETDSVRMSTDALMGLWRYAVDVRMLGQPIPYVWIQPLTDPTHTRVPPQYEYSRHNVRIPMLDPVERGTYFGYIPRYIPSILILNLLYFLFR